MKEENIISAIDNKFKKPLFPVLFFTLHKLQKEYYIVPAISFIISQEGFILLKFLNYELWLLLSAFNPKYWRKSK